MTETTEFAAFWMAVLVQVIGLVSLVGARCTEGCWAHVIFQRLFIASLIVVGLTTSLALQIGSANWHPCAMMLGVMAIGATIDGGSGRRPAVQ